MSNNKIDINNSVSSVDSNNQTDYTLDNDFYYRLLTLERKLAKKKNNIKLLD